MKRIILLFFSFTVLNTWGYCQNDIDILFQYSGQSTTIRKSGENNPILYSERHDRLLTFKEELAAYSDTIYYLVKPTVVIFSAKTFESNVKPQINIRVDYYYQKSTDKKVKIDSWGKSYYPSIQKVVKMQDTRETDGRVLFTMNDKSEWLVEKDKDGTISLFYLSHDEFSYLNFALMFPNCKADIVNGIR